MKKRVLGLAVVMCSVATLMPVTLLAGGVTESHTSYTDRRPEVVSSGYTRYTVDVSVPSHGELKANSTRITDSSLVKITVTPDFGYQLDTITATTKSGSNLTVERQKDGTYGFLMPKEDVSVSATFKLK